MASVSGKPQIEFLKKSEIAFSLVKNIVNICSWEQITETHRETGLVDFQICLPFLTNNLQKFVV